MLQLSNVAVRLIHGVSHIFRVFSDNISATVIIFENDKKKSEFIIVVTAFRCSCRTSCISSSDVSGKFSIISGLVLIVLKIHC